MKQERAYKKQELSMCEAQVMKVLWDSGTELIMLEITERANKRYGYNWKPQTVSTFLARLYKKGYIMRVRSSRTFYYSPLKKSSEYVEGNLKSILTDWYNGDKDKLIETIRNIKTES